MAIVTVELRDLLKTDFELFDFEYRFDDDIFKKELESAIIDHYYFHEIGEPTPERFKQRFKTRWLRIIGTYNELYNTTLLKYDILTNYSLTDAMEQLTTNNQETVSSGDVQTSTDSNTKNSDYPQQPIAGGDYLANEGQTTTESTTNDTSTSRTTADNTNTYQKKVEGLTGSTYPDLIRKHRENLINIKQLVIDEMKPCFILVY